MLNAKWDDIKEYESTHEQAKEALYELIEGEFRPGLKAGTLDMYKK